MRQEDDAHPEQPGWQAGQVPERFPDPAKTSLSDLERRFLQG